MHTLIHTRASNAKKPTPHALVLIPQRTAVAFLHHLLNYTEKQVNILFSMIIQHLLQLFKIYGHGCAAATNAGKLMAFEPPLCTCCGSRGLDKYKPKNSKCCNMHFR